MFTPGRIGWLRRLLALGIGLAAGFDDEAARAVVGGREESGGLARSAAMVLNSHGGMCSAVVLAPDVVATAAHCLRRGDEIRVHVRGDAAAPVLMEPAAVAIHPGFAADAVAARRRSVDLALVRLREPLPGGFAAATLSGEAPRRDDGVTLGGYGVAREGEARSTGVFRTAPLTVVEPYGPSAILLWASAPNGSASGGCEGDSGGPIAAADGAVVAVLGWASGSGARRCGGLSQGVRLGPQRGWIDATLGRWGRSARWQ